MGWERDEGRAQARKVVVMRVYVCVWMDGWLD